MGRPSHFYLGPQARPPRNERSLVVSVRTKPIGTTGSDPHACESLNSWLSRLALANGYFQTPDEIAYCAGFPPSLHFDLPLHPSAAAHALSNISGRSNAEIVPMLLRYELPETTSGYDLVLRTWALQKISKRADTSTVHVVCPSCLDQDLEPYWRRHWRLCTTVVCEIHDEEMLDRCPSCEMKFMAPSRSNLPLNHCRECGARIENFGGPAVKNVGPLIWQALSEIYAQDRSFPARYAVLPCRALRRLLDLACSSQEDMPSIESVVRRRESMGHADRLAIAYGGRFRSHPIGVRRRAIALVEEFALRRPTDFRALVHGELSYHDWFAMIQGLFPRADPRSARVGSAPGTPARRNRDA